MLPLLPAIMSNDVLTRIEAIQQELERLKQKVLTQEQGDSPSGVSADAAKLQLRGIWQGGDLSDQLLEDAERSLIAEDFREGSDRAVDGFIIDTHALAWFSAEDSRLPSA